MCAFYSRVCSLNLLRLTLGQCGLSRSTLSAACQHTGPSKPIVRFPNPDLDKYRNLQKKFKRRLRSAYSKLYDLQDKSEICGHNHVYVLEGGGIYRVDRRQSEAEAELLLDLEQVSPGGDQARGERGGWVLQRVRLSPSERRLAASVQSADGEQAKCVVMKLADSSSAPEDPSHMSFTLDNVFSFEWASDEVLFYTTLEGLRCSRVSRLDLGPPAVAQRAVFEDTRPDVFVEVSLSRDGRILTINSNSQTDSEVWIVDLTAPHLEPVLVQQRRPELMYHVEHWGDWLVILANTGPGQEYQVLRAPLTGPAPGPWVPLYAPPPGVTLRDLEVVGAHCVLTIREAGGALGLTTVPLAGPSGGYTVPLPLWACSCEALRPGPADPQDELRLLLSSPASPPVPFLFKPRDRLLSPGSEAGGTPPGGGHTPPGGGHTVERLEVQSQDSTTVPLTLFHSLGAGGLQTAPLLAHVYGAYGRDLSMRFSPESAVLLELGWVLAYCHIRGGGERGLAWHRGARAGGKPRGVEDLRACLLHLHSRGVSSPRRSALSARSAGAVPVGALCNADPHLVRAVTLQAPFLDVLGSMSDGSLPLTLEEREEWGDPTADPQHRLTVASYCPLHNIAPQCYPSMLLTVYSEDVRVPLAGVVRYAANIKDAVHTHSTERHAAECDHAPRVVLDVQPGADHFGPNHLDLMLEEKALQLAFLYTELDLEPPPRRRRRGVSKPPAGTGTPSSPE